MAEEDSERIQFRTLKTQIAAIRAQAEDIGISPSEWLRRVCDAGLTYNWVGQQRRIRIEEAPAGPRQLGMRVIMPRGECMHPPTAYEARGPFDTVCGLCGHVVRRIE